VVPRNHASDRSAARTSSLIEVRAAGLHDRMQLADVLFGLFGAKKISRAECMILSAHSTLCREHSIRIRLIIA